MSHRKGTLMGVNRTAVLAAAERRLDLMVRLLVQSQLGEGQVYALDGTDLGLALASLAERTLGEIRDLVALEPESLA